jgi:hypothetical protein
MDVDLDFCLKRFVDDELTDSIKHVGQLERNFERKRIKILETSQVDDVAICHQEDTFVEEFTNDLNENNMAINRTRQIIEDGFRKALDNIKVDVEIIAEISSSRNNNRQNNEEIRTASNKIRQQIARVDSELTHLFNMIDYNNSIDYSSRIIPWFRQHYGYADELNRIVGKNSTSGDISTFSEKSSLMQCILKRVRLWKSRQKLINKFTHQMDEDSITTKQLTDTLYRMTDTSSALKFIQSYIQRRQEGRRRREEHVLHKMERELEQQRLEQQALAIELVNALCQLSVNSAHEFQINKKLKKVLQKSEVSKQFVPVLIDLKEEATGRRRKQSLINLVYLS